MAAPGSHCSVVHAQCAHSGDTKTASSRYTGHGWDLHSNLPVHKLPCKVNYLGPHFPRTQQIEPKKAVVPWLSSWCASSGTEVSSANSAAHLCWDCNRNYSTVHVGTQDSPCWSTALLAAEVPVLVYLLTSAWEKPISTGEAPGSCLSSHYWHPTEHTGSCYFAASCQSDALWHLQSNWPNFTSNKQQTRRKRLRELKTKGFRFP